MIATLEAAQTINTVPSVFERWIDDYGDFLYKFAVSRLHDRSAAEDAVQETFLAAMRSHQHFSNASTEKTWITGILKHKIADQYRSMFRTVSFSNFSPLDETDVFFFRSDGHWAENFTPRDGTAADQTANLDHKDFVRSLRTALSVIPQRLAIVFTLREIEGLKTSEICSLLNITSDNLFVMLHRARLHLREVLTSQSV